MENGNERRTWHRRQSTDRSSRPFAYTFFAEFPLYERSQSSRLVSSQRSRLCRVLFRSLSTLHQKPKAITAAILRWHEGCCCSAVLAPGCLSAWLRAALSYLDGMKGAVLTPGCLRSSSSSWLLSGGYEANQLGWHEECCCSAVLAPGCLSA